MSTFTEQTIAHLATFASDKNNRLSMFKGVTFGSTLELPVYAVLFKYVVSKDSPIAFETIICFDTPYHKNKLHDKLVHDKSAYFYFDILDTHEGTTSVIDNSITNRFFRAGTNVESIEFADGYKHDSRKNIDIWINSYRDNNWERHLKQVLTVKDALDVPVTSLRNLSSDNLALKCLYNHKSDYINGKIEYIQPYSAETELDTVCLKLANIKLSYIDNIRFQTNNTSSVNDMATEDDIKEETYHIFQHKSMDLEIAIHQNSVQEVNIKAINNRGFTEVGIITKSEFNNPTDNTYWSNLQHRSLAKLLISDRINRTNFHIKCNASDNAFKHGIESIHKQLSYNISHHIQYNHFTHASIGDVHVAMNLLSTMSKTDYSQFIDQFMFEYKNVDTREEFERNELFKVKRTHMVPKNGEKFAGQRAMVFRNDLENMMMAVGVSKIYDAIIVPSDHLGSRVTNNIIVPYIHTYNLFKDQCMELAKVHNNCVYLDLSKYFETVNFELVEKSVLHFTHAEQSEGVKRALNLIRNAMIGSSESHNFLTIDTNYEHAISTVVMAYLFDTIDSSDLNVSHRSFVDDMVIFAHNQEELNQFYNRLSTRVDELGLILNDSKELWFEGEDYDMEIKSLVFLPTGLRYRLDSTLPIDAIKQLKKIGYESFLTCITKPVITAYSDVSMFKRNFQYEEAKWVIENYDSAINDFAPNVYHRPNDKNILALLQYYTLNMTTLSRVDIINLMIIMEEYPSKQKWIMSILMNSVDYAFAKELRSIYSLHKTEYMRYISADECNSSKVFCTKDFKQVDITDQYVRANNEDELCLIQEKLLELGYDNVDRNYRSFGDWDMVNDTNNTNTLAIRYNLNSKKFKVVSSAKSSTSFTDFVPVAYQYDLWIWLVINSKSLYTNDLTA